MFRLRVRKSAARAAPYMLWNIAERGNGNRRPIARWQPVEKGCHLLICPAMP
jgi:hypothetical protein